MPHLQYTGPDGATQRFPLTRRLISIGSSPESHLVLSGDEVAPAHCTLTHEPGRFVLDSTARANVFYVRGKKTRSHELKHGDIITLGGHEIIFSAVDAPEPKPLAPQDTAKQEIEAMKRLQSFSELLLRPDGDLDDLLNELIDQVVALSRARKGFLVLADGDKYTIRVARHLDRQPVDDPSQLLSDNIIREVISTRQPAIISDALSDKRFNNSLSVIALKLSSVMCVPLIVRGELLGLIYVGNDNAIALFNKADLETLKVFAAQAALFIKSAKVLSEVRTESAGLAERLENVRFGQIIGSCPQMIEVYKRVDKVAGIDVTVLVTGETGTGKELIAREIHERSPRAKGPMITVNCGAIPENLIESELFGHIKGAFTGAVANQIGKFQAADKGTIFLDEIGELPLAMQVKLLRVLQEKAVQRLGENRAIPLDIRVVAATNRDLQREVAEGNFREDLYHRLNVINVHLPPLRDRGDDVILIARYLVGRYGKEFGRELDPSKAFDPSALKALLRFSWPGNIRQLENHIKKALVLADGPTLTARDLDLAIEVPSQDPSGASIVEVSDLGDEILPLTEARDLWQRSYINRVLALNNGNRTKTARDLGVDPRTIFRHLEKEEKSSR
ncbi:MAG: sigma 54-interacting transcriptional regulator [Myxococcales bacterium]|nr:sigma 54-interacting transcriptional regulator [Myxococcales bacterium]MCB9702685.1 sigma 54-interacting transcriptional regulator [Myxococcales bacterium]